MKSPKIISKKMIFKSKFIKVFSAKIKLPNEKIVNWNYNMWCNEGVAVVPIDDKNNIYLSKEWRPAWQKKIVVIPAGGVKINVSEKEGIKQARNELREEIGLDAKKIEKLVTLLYGTRIKGKIHVYLATGLFKSFKRRDSDEIIEIIRMPFKRAYKMFLTGKEKTTGYTLLGMSLAKEKLKIRV
jgi:ADP-ribose pyrophosphatase